MSISDTGWQAEDDMAQSVVYYQCLGQEIRGKKWLGGFKPALKPTVTR